MIRQLISAILATAVAGGLYGCRSADGAGNWKLAASESFDSAKALDSWHLEGPADVSVTPKGELQIETRQVMIDGEKARCSVLWFGKPINGDVRYEFDARGELGNRCLFFFNARPLKGQKSIFDWQRSTAKYMDYAGEPRMQLYTLGMLRYDQEDENLRIVGGELAEYLKQMEAVPRGPERKRRNEIFQRKTILQSFPRAAKSPDRMSHYALTVTGARIVLEVDGATVLDVVDEHRKANPLRGGYFGFRNFRPSRAWYDNLRAYRR